MWKQLVLASGSLQLPVVPENQHLAPAEMEIELAYIANSAMDAVGSFLGAFARLVPINHWNLAAAYRLDSADDGDAWAHTQPILIYNSKLFF